MPSITKDRISSPLEAGPSLLDVKQLPAQLNTALEYASSRLARKRLHLSLIVVRADTKLPAFYFPQSASPSSGSPTFSPPLSQRSSVSSLFDSGSSGTSSPCLTSSTSSFSPIASSSNPYGISLIHASTMSAKAEKILRQTIAKAEKKFSIGSGWLSEQPLTNKITCNMTNDLIRRSLQQNEVLFSSEGLTLLSLDHVYKFKCTMHAYSRTLSPYDFTLSVDELRRLVLAQQGRRITKGYLMRAYDWLGISLSALVDINEGYKTAYGGLKREGGIEVQNEERRSPNPLSLKTNFVMQEIAQVRLDVRSASDEKSGVEEFREDKGPHRRGPVTPNGFEDLTPITKGEWCFLMVGEGWSLGRTGAVETC